MITLRRLLLIALLLGSHRAFASAPNDDNSETVLIRYSVKAGREQQLLAALGRAWATYRQLDLVPSTPRFVVRGEGPDGAVYVVELFTWRDSSTPDHAPPAVLERWRELNEACETRAGRPGIDFSEVTLLDPATLGPTQTSPRS